MRTFAERGFHGTSVPEIAQEAGVGVGSIYRCFDGKERLVNAVFRSAKTRLRDALLLGLDFARPPREVFADLWSRLARFQREDPLAFQFLEMQDHAPYLDGESRALEASVLVPLFTAIARAMRSEDMPAHAGVVMALVWGAFVGMIKAERHGYLALTDDDVDRAGEACFALVSTALAGVEPR